jgi:hypothetical protein
LELFQQGYNCCQIITVYLADVCGFDASEIKDSLNIMCDTCGGTCSTLRGGAYCLRMYAKNKGWEREQANELVDKLFDAFREKHGGILCKEIAQNDMMVCAGFVDTVVELVKKIVAEDQD